ncbi:MAG: hypothetical protein ACFFB3_19310 [Candidatus Hodarchaeota archaeon]
MQLFGCLTGIHPFSEELVQAILGHKYGRTAFDPVKKEFKADLTNLIKLQQQLEFGLVTTGNLGWWDLFRPFVEHLEGILPFETVSELPVARHPLTNTFYRKATITGKVTATEPILTEKSRDPFLGVPIIFNQYLPPELKKKGWLAILPGPYHFQYASQGSSSQTNIISDFADVLISEIRALESLGFSHVLLDESPLTWQQRTRQTPHQEHLAATQEALQKIAKKSSVIIYVHTFNGKITWQPPTFDKTILDLLLDAKVGGIGIDFLQTKISDISDSSLREIDLIAGVVDATSYTRDSKGESTSGDSEEIIAQAKQLLELEPQRVILAPTTRLEMIPRVAADQKLRTLAKAIQHLRKEED